jgi:leader peptidase (prepilin peptidase)/N-methyltransferase
MEFTNLAPYVLAALGAILASFAGVISERLNTGESWLSSRSRCNSCARLLGPFDMVPVLSWFATLGRCRSCSASVPYRYALSEATLAAIFFICARMYPLDITLALLLAVCFLLMIIVLYDLRHTIVPLPLALLLIVLALFYAFLTSISLHELARTLLVAGAIGSGFFLMHALSKGKWMGLGDAPIALALSLVAGPLALAGLLFSFWIGAAIGIIILVTAPRGHRMGIEVPFVPFLAAGYLLALFTQWNPLLF